MSRGVTFHTREYRLDRTWRPQNTKIFQGRGYVDYSVNPMRDRAQNDLVASMPPRQLNPLDRSVEGMYLRTCLVHKLPLNDELKCPHGHTVKMWGVSKAAW